MKTICVDLGGSLFLPKGMEYSMVYHENHAVFSIPDDVEELYIEAPNGDILRATSEAPYGWYATETCNDVDRWILHEKYNEVFVWCDEKIYISGSITGTEDYMERFAKAEEDLEERGWKAINPAKVNATLPKETSYEDYMRVSMTLLGLCGSIYMLKGWENSQGAQLELQYAKTMGYNILFEERS